MYELDHNRFNNLDGKRKLKNMFRDLWNGGGGGEDSRRGPLPFTPFGPLPIKPFGSRSKRPGPMYEEILRIRRLPVASAIALGLIRPCKDEGSGPNEPEQVGKRYPGDFNQRDKGQPREQVQPVLPLPSQDDEYLEPVKARSTAEEKNEVELNKQKEELLQQDDSNASKGDKQEDQDSKSNLLNREQSLESRENSIKDEDSEKE